MIIAVIPARGGSKRIPRKNIKHFHGRPIISYSIERAFESKIFDKVYVSTDDAEICDVSKSLGAEIIKRPPELADDFTSLHSVMNHAAKELAKKNNDINYICCIYATAPFLECKNLVEGLDILKSGNCKVVFAASEYAYPVHRSFFINVERE